MARLFRNSPSSEASMCKIINPMRRPCAISTGALDSRRLCRIAFAAVVIAAPLHPSTGMAQGSAYGLALNELASDPRAYASGSHGQPLLPSDVSHILRDWGL